MTVRYIGGTLAATALCAALVACGAEDPAKYIASAESYMAKSDYRAAIIQLKNAVAKAPQNARARFLLGQNLLAAGDAVGAATEFRKALEAGYSADEAYPALARTLVMQNAPLREMVELADAPMRSPAAKADVLGSVALAELRQGTREAAKARIDAALAADPTNVTARTAQAQLLAAAGDSAAALAAVDAVLASAPADTYALLLKGELETTMGKHADALRTFERTVAAHPEAVRARFALVSGYIQARQLDKAAAEVDQLKKIAAGDPRTEYSVAYLAFARGDDIAANESIQKVTQVAPNFLPARYLSGLLDLKRGAYSSAEDSLRMVVAQAPTDDGARIALAETYLRRAVPAKAQETLAPVLTRSPDNANALRLAGEIQLALRNNDKSAQYISRANALEKNSLTGRVRLAEVSIAKGDTVQGMKELETLSVEQPGRGEPDLALIGAHLRARDFDKALAAANALVKKQPASAAAQNALGSVYMLKGDRKAARAPFEKALELDPNLEVAAINLARVELQDGNFDAAKKRFAQVLARNPKSEAALIGTAETLAVAKAPPAEVNAALQKAIDANPGSVASRLALIGSLARQKDWKAALTAAQAAQAAIPDNVAILEALAGAQQAAGETNQALETYGRIVKLQPTNAVPLIRMAALHLTLKDTAGAINALKSAVALAPDSAPALVALAAAYVNSNQADAGLREAQRMQKEAPAKAVGYALEAEILVAQKRAAEAAVAYRNALAREQTNYLVIRQYALLNSLGKADDAAAVAQKWLKDHPKDVQVRAFMGQQSLAKGDHKAAIPNFRAALANDPNNVLILNNLAWSLSQVNDPSALQYAERAYRAAPDMPEVINTYGWVLVNRGDTQRGLELLRRSVEIVPGDPEKRLGLARALIKTGDKAAARKELEVVAKTESPAARSQAEQLLKTL